MSLKQNKTYKYNISKLSWKKKTILNFGTFGFVSKETKFIDISPIKSSKFFINRFLRKNYIGKFKLWDLSNYVYPCFKKTTHSRMGKGAGKFLEYRYYIKRGSIIFEFNRVCLSLLKELCQYLKKKVGFKFKLILRV